MNTLTKNLKLVLGMAIAIVACTEARQKTEEVEDAVAKRVASEAQKTYRTITTPIKSINGSGLRGEATFKELENGAIDLTVRLNGVSPGEHAVHLHENGDCSAVDGSSAGGHWNPMDVSHGHRLEDEQFHQGDIGNITVGADSSGLLVTCNTSDRQLCIEQPRITDAELGGAVHHLWQAGPRHIEKRQ